MSRKIKKDDEVIVISGKEKGKVGKVIKIKNKLKVFISGINMVKKHKKPNPNEKDSGGIIEKEAPINISNVAIFNRYTKKADKVRFIFEKEKKIRIFKSNKKRI
ncbi:50S ribosomal protein L24 [bacterium endosymbiont of Pedicinus badii]|uniref:50S ribosomal protein L24 n=1 Tax=bacterium endosymbiont of Pedicinus badii TaxID=1719126 RepID=UPI0009BC6DCB|nr:50S ribosomal protein L24 [bacterium endosymbiont of Pedicinus badii]OQM34267.1 50S ribosomal protein L24 [bacterium endosymbiont of Pedicinus badii]